MNHFETTNNPKYNCEKCCFKTNNKKDYNKHCLTRKHLKLPLNETNETIGHPKKSVICDICSKTFNSRTTLWRHKKICKIEEPISLEVVDKKEEISVLDAKMMFDMFKELMLEQSKSMMEIVKSCNTTNNINNGQIQNTHNNNTQFNIQMYLNETCKNAMTIDEFLDYLQPTLEELEATARLGYVEGITRIIMRGLKDLEEELLPFHCTDLKRESLFVKNPDGEWEKETDEKPLMLKFVKAVARKNFNNVNEWRKLHPNCRYHDSKSNDMFNQIMLNSMSGSTEEEQQSNYNKIIKNIVKEVVIDKSKKNKK